MWLLHIFTEEASQWHAYGAPFESVTAACIEAERLRRTDPTVRQYRVARAR